VEAVSARPKSDAPERSQLSNDIGVVLFALVDAEQVRAMRPYVTPGAALLLKLIDRYPAACRWAWLPFVSLQIWPDEPYAHEAMEIAVAVDGRRAHLAEIAP
jgi:hypothetical protein